MAADDPKDTSRIGNSGWMPATPDPTALTTEQVRREVSALREIITTRLDAMDRAAELLNANVTRVPTDTDKQIQHLKELHDEKFLGIQKQFNERDVRSDQASTAGTKAIDAAFLAAQKAADATNEANLAAIAKSEGATAKQLEGITYQIESKFSAISARVDDIKGRLDRGEGAARGPTNSEQMMSEITRRIDTVVNTASGVSTFRGEQRLNIGSVTGVAGLVVAILVAFMMAVTVVSHQSAAPTVVSPAVVPMQSNK